MSSSEHSKQPDSNTGMVAVSCPGKMILAGEYAVLRGASAVITAVNRRATATWSREGGRGPMWTHLRTHRRTADSKGTTLRSHNCVVDTSAFRAGGVKLGFGSSAAATVAATAFVLQSKEREELLQFALDVHRGMQGEKGHPGSGVDVASCAYGGTICATPKTGTNGVEVSPMELPTVNWVCLWSQKSASTPELVEGVFRHSPGKLEPLLTAVGDASEQVAAAQNPTELLTGLKAGRAAIARLGTDTGMELELESQTVVLDRAEAIGGAGKTTGAGGGDVFICAFPLNVDTTDFLNFAREQGMRQVDIVLGEEGVRFDPEGKTY